MTYELGAGESKPTTFRVGEPDSSGTTVSISEAARRSGVSISTLRRRLTKGQVAGAHKAPGPDGEEWRIPVAALDDLGSAPTGERTTSRDDLQRELDNERRAREHAEQLAAAETRRADSAERAREDLSRTIEGLLTTIETLNRALPPAPTPVTETQQETGRRWFGRKKATP